MAKAVDNKHRYAAKFCGCFSIALIQFLRLGLKAYGLERTVMYED